MPVQIGAKAHSFSEPTGLLSDCHRRIEMFLGSLQQVGVLIHKPLSADAHAALESALRYFREAAPKHTADEEQSLFPRLRQVHDPDVKAALERLEPLENEHRQADLLHAEVDHLGRKCLEAGDLSTIEANRFRQAVAQLISIYKEHIHIEDEVVFPLAGRLLSKTDKAAIASEMAARRK
jgi:iron-sulfur cluster repair protein YtfE (RIC family)